jgi:DNA-binding transcriptional MerR regulator
VTPKLYKAADVCELTGLQPYVLRSWEKEFPGIGVQKSADSPRLYRQADVDQVVRIKQLVFSEGLTLAGARRRLEDVPSAPSRAADTQSEMDEVLDVLGADARARIAAVRTGLRSLLEALSKAPGAVAIGQVRESAANGNGGSRGKPARRKVAVAAKRAAPTKRASTQRKPARTAKRSARARG